MDPFRTAGHAVDTPPTRGFSVLSLLGTTPYPPCWEAFAYHSAEYAVRFMGLRRNFDWVIVKTTVGELRFISWGEMIN